MRCLPLVIPGAGGHGCDAREFGECGFGLDALGVVADHDEDFRGCVHADAERLRVTAGRLGAPGHRSSVARLLTAGLQGARRWRTSWVVPSTAAIWKARSRLGMAPLRQLFARVC